jgi:predicted nucleotidyltransferase
MHPAIAQHRTGINTICQRYHISRLEVFGSVARADDFNPASINRNREAVYAA